MYRMKGCWNLAVGESERLSGGLLLSAMDIIDIGSGKEDIATKVEEE